MAFERTMELKFVEKDDGDDEPALTSFDWQTSHYLLRQKWVDEEGHVEWRPIDIDYSK